MSPPKFTSEELRGLALLKRLPAETLDLLAVRLNKLDDVYCAPQHSPVEIREEEGSFFLYRLRPGYSRPVPIAVEKHRHRHRWNALAPPIDNAFREAIPGGQELGYPSDGGPTAPLTLWAVQKIIGDRMVTLPAVAKALQRQRNRPRQT
jgi:hypothetical protein